MQKTNWIWLQSLLYIEAHTLLFITALDHTIWMHTNPEWFRKTLPPRERLAPVNSSQYFMWNVQLSELLIHMCGWEGVRKHHWQMPFHLGGLNPRVGGSPDCRAQALPTFHLVTSLAFNFTSKSLLWLFLFFSKLERDFDIKRKLILVSLPAGNFTTESCSICNIIIGENVTGYGKIISLHSKAKKKLFGCPPPPTPN